MGREEAKERAVGKGQAKPRTEKGRGRSVYEPGKTLCPHCEGTHGERPAKASLDVKREALEEEQAERDEGKAGLARVKSTRKKFRWMKCGRCQKTFKAIVEPKKAEDSDPKNDASDA